MSPPGRSGTADRTGTADPGVGDRRSLLLHDISPGHRCPRPVRLHALARAPYFVGLTEQELGRVDDRMRSSSWAAGEYVFHAGEPARSLYVVAQGTVRMSQVTEEGTQTVTDLLVAGELFGAMGSIGEPYHLQSASALVPTCTLRIDQGDFRDVLATQPRVGLRVLDDVVARLVRAQSDIGGQGTETVRQRTATALLRLVDKVGRDRGRDGIALDVPLSRADLAGLARSTPESVSRVMSRWKRQGVIDSGRQWTVVLDLERLRAEADGA